MHKPAILLRCSAEVPSGLAKAAAGTLEGAFSAHVTLSELGPLPPTAFDIMRRQYLSELILAWLISSTSYGEYDVVVGLIDVDAYAPGLNFVFGEAMPYRRVCAVYLARLRPEFYGEEADEALLYSRVAKEVLHEVGHVFGLRHCANRLCVMHFSNSILDTDVKRAKFCGNCARRLAEFGIAVNEGYLL